MSPISITDVLFAELVDNISQNVIQEDNQQP